MDRRIFCARRASATKGPSNVCLAAGEVDPLSLPFIPINDGGDGMNTDKIDGDNRGHLQIRPRSLGYSGRR